MSEWSTSSLPTKTVMTSVDPTMSSTLHHIYTSAAGVIETVTDKGDLIDLSRTMRGAKASLAVISAENLRATATQELVQSQATQAIFNQTLNLKDLRWDENLYDLRLSRPANIIYFALFAILFLYYVSMTIPSRYEWFNVTFVCGYTLEFIGFLGRILAFTDWSDMNYFLLQFVSLTLAPAFIMAGIYFTFAQLVVVFGRQFSVLRPMWYSYLFITFDVISLAVQAIGGAIASEQTKNRSDSDSGTNIMIAGIAFQVFCMSIFLSFWFEFLNRIFFKNRKLVESDSPLKKRGLINFFKFLFNTKQAADFRVNHLEPHYNPHYRDLRFRKLMPYYPLAMTFGTVVVYIRCVYRVVELAQGWTGYLITHEVYLMTLDALMIAFNGLTFIPFHPYWVFGKENKLKVATIQKNKDTSNVHYNEEKLEEKSSFTSSPSLGNDNISN